MKNTANWIARRDLLKASLGVAVVISSAHWIMNAIVSLLFPDVATHSRGMPFLFFASMMLLQVFVVLHFFPETKGATLEQLPGKTRHGVV